MRALETDALVLPGVGAFSAAAERLAPGRALGVQFHPEKSSEAGVRLLRAFVEGARR